MQFTLSVYTQLHNSIVIKPLLLRRAACILLRFFPRTITLSSPQNLISLQVYGRMCMTMRYFMSTNRIATLGWYHIIIYTKVQRTDKIKTRSSPGQVEFNCSSTHFVFTHLPTYYMNILDRGICICIYIIGMYIVSQKIQFEYTEISQGHSKYFFS